MNKSRIPRFLVPVALLAALAPVPASAQSGAAEPAGVAGPAGVRYVIADRTLTAISGEQRLTVRIPCAGHVPAAASDTHLFVACGERGVLMFSLANPADPEPLELLPLGAAVTDIYVLKDRVWIELADGVARPADALMPHLEADHATVSVPAEGAGAAAAAGQADQSGQSGQAPGEGAAKPELPRVEGRVIDVGPEFVVISLGRKHGLTDAMNIELLEGQAVTLASGNKTSNFRRLDIGSIVRLEEDYAHVRLSFNSYVPVGAYARPTNEWIYEGNSMRRRAAGLSVFKVGLRPFLPIGQRGIGAVADLSYGYRFDLPMALDFSLNPLVATMFTGDNDLVFSGNGIFSYDSSFGKIGFGFGMARVRTREEISQIYDPDTGTYSDVLNRYEGGLRFSVVQHGRLGAADGTHVELTTQFVMNDTWEFGGMMLGGQLDTSGIHEKTWLLGRMGGGSAGYVILEAGLRMLIRGNGGPGSLFLTPMLGLTYSGDNDRTSDGYGGPMLGLSMEWRD